MDHCSPIVYRWSRLVTEEKVEEWENRLIGADVTYSVEFLTKRTKLRLSSFSEDRAAMEQLREAFGGGVTRILPEDWQPTEPGAAGPVIRIRNRLIVSESSDEEVWQDLRETHPEKEVLSFPPQLAFGTGSHPTTANCLRLLADTLDLWRKEKSHPTDWSLLDLGCGSGILAIAAARLGARRVVAVEFDEMALRCARENAKRHQVEDRIEFVEGDAVAWIQNSDQNFDIIAANLFSELLLEILPCCRSLLTERGQVIVSGFLTTQAKEIVEKSRAKQVSLRTFLRNGNWVAASTLDGKKDPSW